MAVEWPAIYLAFLAISTTSLLPWNLFMNAHEYFNYKFRNVSMDDLGNSTLIIEPTTLQRSYEGWVTVIGGLACLAGSTLNFAAVDSLSNSCRVISGHLMVLMSFLPSLLLTFINTDYMQDQFFWISMLLAAIAGFGSTGLLGCGLLGYSARFPALYMQSVMLGQSFAGILSSLLSIFCKAFTSTPILDGRLFFTIATLWTLMSILAYCWLSNSPLAAAVMISESTTNNALQQEGIQQSRQQLLEDTDDDDNDDQPDMTRAEDSLQLRRPQSSRALFGAHVKLILSMTKLEMVSGFCVLFGTLLVFPAIASMVESTSEQGLWRVYFSAIACFLLFNLGDAIGRLLFKVASTKGRLLVALSILRFTLIPLIFVCNIRSRLHSMTLIQSDTIFIVLISLLAISNGLLFTSASVTATRKVDEEFRELIGSLIGLMAIVSSLFGSIFGALLVEFV